MSFATQHNWGTNKISKLKSWLNKLVVLDINSTDQQLLETYAEIDSFSKNKLISKPLGRSMTMGKNELWIAATAKVAGATLLTIDGDFDHLNGIYITVKKY